MTLKERLVQQWEQVKNAQVPVVIEMDQDDHETINRLPLMDVVPSFAITLSEAQDRIIMLQAYVKDMMVAGVDYGYIPGCQKPSLLKPGAEKLCDIFGFSKQIEVIDRVVDWEKGIFSYEVKAILINKRTGLVEAEGLGCCNSMEMKYRQQDGFSVSNTILKMAKKRALVDAVLSATRSSAMFTQDVEDIDQPDIQQTKNKKQNQDAEVQIFSRPKPPQNGKRATDNQLKKIYALTKEIGMPVETARQLLKDRYAVHNSKDLSIKQASDFIQHLLLLKS